MTRYVPGEMDREALAVLRAELSARGRGALAHLMNNALTPALVELGMEEEPDLEEVRRSVTHVVGVVREVTRDDD